MARQFCSCWRFSASLFPLPASLFPLLLIACVADTTKKQTAADTTRGGPVITVTPVNRGTTGMAERVMWALSPDRKAILVVVDPGGVENEPVPNGFLFADETRLEQVVANLLDNACKYTPAGGRLELEVGVEGGDAVLRLSDTGSGIPSELLPHVFDIFTQGPRTRDRAQGGLGLGLTVVRRLVELHGGTVSATSAGADRGTLAFLCEAYHEDQAPDEKGEMQTRVVMRFHPRIAPIKAAVFPLVKKDGMPEIAQRLYRAIKPHMTVFYDEKGAVGRRYRRQDEAGTPFCITDDGQTLQDGTVTVRDRDSLKQDRVHERELIAALQERMK